MSGSAVPRLADHRLAWLAMREHCERQARRRGVFDWLTILFAGRYDALYEDDFDPARAYGSGHNRDLLREGRNDTLMDYAVAVDLCTKRLSPAERTTLRTSGTLPDWFVDAVEQERASLRR
jgi:hypothetical protein